jgi:hypothetical protein
MLSIDIAAEIEEIAICSKVEPSELLDALKAGMLPDDENMTRVQSAVNEVFNFVDELNCENDPITIEDCIEAGNLIDL